MEELYCVYKHTAPNGKVYVGQTKRGVYDRWKDGKGYTCHRHGWFWKAIEKYGWDNIKHEILFDDLSKELADYYEQFFINVFKSTDRQYGYNCQSGGSRNYRYSEESKKNISNGLKKRYKEKGYPKGSLAALQRGRSKQSRKIVQYDLNGHKIAEYRSAIEAEKETGIPHAKIDGIVRDPKRCRQTGGFMWLYKEEAAEIIEPYKKKRPCVQYGLDGSRIQEWDDVKQADLYYSRKKKRVLIEHCCDGSGFKTAYGYQWRFSENAPNILPPYSIGKPICQYDHKGNFIKEWGSASEIQKELGLNVKNCCEGRSLTTYGYQWRYKGDLSHPVVSIKKPHVMNKPIMQFSKEGEFISEYKSTKDAAIKTNINFKNIQCCASGKNMTAGGYIWKYKNDVCITQH